ncbi:mitochondrial translocator assembly and maintenance protein 41 [Marchantia polymorpha subsp. ruderalis]|uniref:Phosphatidate cytidylyltransferase, mitochondrial n=2 Tax=Marchantia polymorpha TaxID=3197 RepID=A0AAF6APX7_MARPO|nr:hypothetical protein MARPO_0019s0171 [Marchantia polymorpha]BBM98497.1 hypothetical protein Mp_1g14010 [Marchantia polymorpha subsp. ruderalis]|eukprot:PTQ44768.1 hypothetical protein MARPO_0019s0171 [Marchantia polymorpha]
MALHRDELAEPLGALPPVEFAFSYGSGVFPQPGVQAMSEKPMVDYILGVSSPSDWHSKNIEKNPHHYSSWLAKFGGNLVSGFADNVGVGVHFNPFVPWKEKTIKYGVIGMDKLKEDIVTWKALYISGRLQKPISILVDKDEVKTLNLRNLKAALYAAMLLAPPELTEEELYINICGLSYLGDIRMFFAEDRRKVQKIVRGSADKFRDLYRGPILRAAESGLLDIPESFGTNPRAKLSQVCDTSRITTLVAGLPKSVLARLGAQTGVILDGQQSEKSIAEAVAQSKEGHAKLVHRAIGRIVRTSSLRQSVSGLFAAGGINAFHYMIKKSSKAWRSWTG